MHHSAILGFVISTVDGWVWDENVNRLMRHLGYAVGYEFDDLDRGAVETGLANTDAEQDSWFDYPLAGERQVTVALAKEPDARPVMVQVSGDLDSNLAARIETLITVFSDSGEDR